MGGFFTFLRLAGLVLAAGVFAILAFGLVGLAVGGVGQDLAASAKNAFDVGMAVLGEAFEFLAGERGVVVRHGG